MNREQQREHFKEKNARRKQHRSKTMYTKNGRELRQMMNGAFGKSSASVYNSASEGTSAIKRSEHDLKDEET